MKKDLLTLSAACLLAISAIITANAQGGANATWRVQKYDLTVTLPQNTERTMTARAVLTIKNVSGSPAGSLTLRISPNADVSSLKINDAPADVTKGEEKFGAAVLQRLGTRFSPVAAGATLTAVVDYKLTVKDNGGVAASSPVGGQMLPLSFWYPTPNSWFFTKGADRAPVSLKINSGSLSVLSGGTGSGGAFEEKLSVQPFFVAGNWDPLTVSGVTVDMPKGTGPEGQKRAAELAAIYSEAKTFMAGVLGQAPDTPLRIIASRRGAGFASGGSVIVDEGVFRRSKIDSLTAMNLAEAAAKLWLGGSIAAQDEGSGVITEGLSRYLATQFLEGKYGKDVADIERLRQRNAYAAVSKRDAPMATVSPVDDFYYPVVANKGAMVWRILARRIGTAEFTAAIKGAAADGSMTVAELRQAFAAQKPLVDYFFDQITDMDLMAGTPKVEGAETHVAIRNTGAADVTVDVVGTTASGERMTASATLRAASIGEVIFKSAKPIVSAEIDAEKLYPQTDYSDDIAPRTTSDSDPLLAAKRAFDKQDYAQAETTAKALLAGLPRFDELRIILGRALLAAGKLPDATREFKAVLEEKLPTSRSMAWANEGMAEAAAKSGDIGSARAFATAAIVADADYGASLAARNLRNTLGVPAAPDASVKAFFADFDRAVGAKRKADVDAMILPGEMSRFASGVAGSAEAWQTSILQTDSLDANTLLADASMKVRLLNKNDESGTAIYRLVKTDAGWKLASVEVFEVR